MIDPEVLDTLPQRQGSNGMAEAVKMGVIADPVLFSLFEDEHPEKHLTEIIHRAICAKRDIVQQDVHDNGQRQILNFGHTLGHALEAASMSTLLHGECVALGMLPFCSKSVAERLVPVLQRVGLPTSCPTIPMPFGRRYSTIRRSAGMKSLLYGRRRSDRRSCAVYPWRN